LDLENAFNTISRLAFLAELYKCQALHTIILLVEILDSRHSIVYNFDPAESLTLYGTVQYRKGVYRSDPLGPLSFNLAICTPLRNIGKRYHKYTAIQALSNDGSYPVKTEVVSRVYRAASEELVKACARVQPEKSSCTIPPSLAPALVDDIQELAPVVTGTRTLRAPHTMDFSMLDGPWRPTKSITYNILLASRLGRGAGIRFRTKSWTSLHRLLEARIRLFDSWPFVCTPLRLYAPYLPP
jgi:hypothetical protein